MVLLPDEFRNFYDKISQLCEQRETEEAIRESVRLISVLEKCYNSNTNKKKILIQLSSIHNMLANIYEEQGIRKLAVEHFRKNISLLKESVALDPWDDTEHKYLWLCVISLGMFHRKEGDFEESYVQFEVALDLAKLSSSVSTNNEHKENIITSLIQLAILCDDELKKRNYAFSYYVEALCRSFQLYEQNSDNKEYGDQFRKLFGTIITGNWDRPFSQQIVASYKKYVHIADQAICETLTEFMKTDRDKLPYLAGLIVMSKVRGMEFDLLLLFFYRYSLVIKIEGACLANTWDKTRSAIESNVSIVCDESIRLIDLLVALGTDITHDLEALREILINCIYYGIDYAFSVIEIDGIKKGRIPAIRGVYTIRKNLKNVSIENSRAIIRMSEEALKYLPDIEQDELKEPLELIFRMSLIYAYINEFEFEKSNEQCNKLAELTASTFSSKARLSLDHRVSSIIPMLVNPFKDNYYDSKLSEEIDLYYRYPDSVIENYAVVGKIGEGAFGEALIVRRVVEGGLTTPLYVLKKSKIKLSPDVRKMVFEEGLRLISIDKPMLCWLESVVNLTIDRSTECCFVMPFAQGGSLADRMSAGKIPFYEAIHHILSMALSLKMLHEEGYVHLDLKPENVLLVFERALNSVDNHLPENHFSGCWMTQLTDFGLSYQIDKLHELRHYRGTPLYSSPEQLAGRISGPATDMYSFGLIAMELLTSVKKAGLLISDSPDVSVDMPFSPLESFLVKNEGNDFASWVTSILQACLHHDPDARPTAQEVVQYFSNYVLVSIEPNGSNIVGQIPEKAEVAICSRRLYFELSKELHWSKGYEAKYEVCRVKFGFDGFRRAFMLAGMNPEEVGFNSAFVTLHEGRDREILNQLDSCLGQYDQPDSPFYQYLSDPTNEKYVGLGGRFEGDKKVADILIPASVIREAIGLYLRTMTSIIEDSASVPDVKELGGLVDNMISKKLFLDSDLERYCIGQAAMIIGRLDEARDILLPILRHAGSIGSESALINECRYILSSPVLKIEKDEELLSIVPLRMIERAQGRYAEAFALSMADHVYRYSRYKSPVAISELLLDIMDIGDNYLMEQLLLLSISLIGGFSDISLLIMAILYKNTNNNIQPITEDIFDKILDKNSRNEVSISKLYIATKAALSMGFDNAAEKLALAALKRKSLNLEVNRRYKVFFKTIIVDEVE